MLNLLRISWPIYILILLSTFAHSIHAQRKNLQESIQIQGNWDEFIEPIYNIGEQGKNFEEYLFNEILNIEKVKKMDGYISPSKTRFILSAYELQHRGVVDFIKDAVNQGFKVKVTVDGNLIANHKALTPQEVEALTSGQKEYYYSTYGSGTQEEINKVQKRYRITKWCWSQLELIKSSHPGLLTLISSPAELYPAVGLNYPRIHHWKEYGVQFKTSINWIDHKTFIPSSNLTNTCLNHKQGRISSSYVNFLRYTRASQERWEQALKDKKIKQSSYDQFISASESDKYKIAYAKTNKNKQTGKSLRSGHIQFGLIFKTPQIIKLFKGDQLSRWEKAYKKNHFFDSVTPRSHHLPEVIFQDSKSGHTSWLRAYFSEGLKKTNANTDFVGTTYNSIFNDPGNSIRVFKSTQFVATHPRVMKKLKAAMILDEFEDFFMVVDGNFSTETYSAFPSLVTSRINDAAGVPWTKVLDTNLLNEERKLQILNSMYSFDGHEGIYGGEGVKLHAKMSYIEYVDSHGTRHYVLIEGSGNLSVNAGKGNADGLNLLDTTDPKLKEVVSPYFEALKNNQRTKPFLETFLQKRFAHIIKYSGAADLEIKTSLYEKPTSPKHIEFNWELINIKDGLLTHEFAKLLKGAYSRQEEQLKLKEILSSITKKGASNKSAFHKNFTRLLRFYISLDTPLRFEQVYQMLYLANPQNHPYQGIVKKLSIDWLERVPDKALKAQTEKKFKQLIRGLSRFDKTDRVMSLDPIERMITMNCSKHFTNLGLQGDFLKIKKGTK